ncbi:MAG: polymerase, sigma-24 subunit, subfamily [Frankiales bacterium]|nr:polymerase, sigma-24 subunit, subfamily [Frankiales bacterium]
MEDDFRELYVARAAALRRTAFLLCGDWHQAEDLVQVSFAKLYAAWRRVDRPEPYLRQVLVRSWIDETRKPHRRERPSADLPDGPISPGSSFEDRELLKAALLRVPPRQRACLVLRFFDDLSVADTARALGINENTVKSQTSRGLDALREIVPTKELL